MLFLADQIEKKGPLCWGPRLELKIFCLNRTGNIVLVDVPAVPCIVAEFIEGLDPAIAGGCVPFNKYVDEILYYQRFINVYGKECVQRG